MIRRLECACCGQDAGRFEQFHNQDTGFGVCRRCVDRMIQRAADTQGKYGMDAAEVRRCYGVGGVNYATSDTATVEAR